MVTTVLTVLSDKNNPSKELASLGLEDVSEVLDKFIYIFNWDYGNTSVTSGPSSANAKFLTYNLQCAVDDINSFLCTYLLLLSRVLRGEGVVVKSAHKKGAGALAASKRSGSQKPSKLRTS